MREPRKKADDVLVTWDGPRSEAPIIDGSDIICFTGVAILGASVPLFFGRFRWRKHPNKEIRR